MFAELITLESHDVFDQQVALLYWHPDEMPM
jgi:hypothetical protein